MRKARNIFSQYLKSSVMIFIGLLLFSCDLIKLKGDQGIDEDGKVPLARVGSTFLFRDELEGIVTSGTAKEDSASRVESYVNSWIRKQLLIQKAMRNVDINEAEVERKVLDYRFSIIAYEYQALHIKKELDTIISAAEVEEYYKENRDNFILKQNIVRATFIKVPKNAPRTERIKKLIFSTNEEDRKELKSYCLSFSTAYQLGDSSWMVFDEIVNSSPLMEIPNKINFLRNNPYYETSDEAFLYFLKVDDYRMSDNVSPLEFVKDEIKNIIINKRKIALLKRLEDSVYEEAVSNDEFEIF